MNGILFISLCLTFVTSVSDEWQTYVRQMSDHEAEYEANHHPVA